MNVKNNSDIIHARYVASAVRTNQYPPFKNTEIAFIGRSNVGKSSLFNSLARQNGLARTSKTPGKTQTLNFYLLTMKFNTEERKDFSLVDLPGYGYAKRGQELRCQWSKFIEEYLQQPRLELVCQLIDIRHAPMAGDIAMHEWLTKNNIPVQIIATKADKISRGQAKKQVDLIRQELKAADTSIIAYSSETRQGREDLLDVIERLLLK